MMLSGTLVTSHSFPLEFKNIILPILSCVYIIFQSHHPGCDASLALEYDSLQTV